MKLSLPAFAVVTLGTPLHVDVDGNRAYVVIPSTYAFKLKGNVGPA